MTDHDGGDFDAFPPTQALPQQLPTPAYGVPAAHPPGRPPRPTSQVVRVVVGVVGAIGALLLLLLVLGVFDGDDGADPVDTIDQPGVPTAIPADAVPAIAQTVFRCPDGAMGSPSLDDPTCVVAASTELVDAVEAVETTYRCPEGATGSPNEARPECAATSSGAVDAVATTTLRCPQGSTGNPTPTNPVCQAADQQVRVPVLAIDGFECEDDDRLDDAVDPPDCVGTATEVTEVAAVEEVTYECDAEAELLPDRDPPGCRQESARDPNCSDPVEVESAWVCLGDLAASVAAGATCPDSSAADPGRPAADPDTTDCYAIVGPACAASATWSPNAGGCLTVVVSDADTVVSLRCPDGVDAPDAAIVDGRCRFTGEVETRSPATPVTEYRCPDGSRGQATGPDSICVATQDGEVRALALTTYACPPGSTGSPTSETPTCTSTTTETVPAIVESGIAYECPAGTVGEPTAADPTCARSTGAVSVPASVVTEFSCPAGSTGTPTFTDPFCTTTE